MCYKHGMELEKKSLARREWKWITKSELATAPVDCPLFSGVAGLLHICAVSKPLQVPFPGGVRTIGDTGYRWLQIAPRNAYWWLTVIVDAEDRLFESYFDITRGNDFSDPLSPTFLDMKLDVTIAPGGTPRILDEEELLEALEAGYISAQEYNLALQTAREIIDWYTAHTQEYYAFLATLYKTLSGGRKLLWSLSTP